MPRINLILEQQVSKKALARKAQGAMLAFGLTTAIGSVINIYLFSQMDSLNAGLGSAKKRLEHLQPLQKKIEENQNRLSETGPRLTTLTMAQEATQRWSRMLNHMTRNTPTNVWLTGIRCEQGLPTDPVKMTVTGMSSNQTLIGDLLLRLKANPDYQSAELGYSDSERLENTVQTKFEITTQIAGTAEEAPVKKEGAKA